MKDYKNWHNKKILINKKDRLRFNEKEIWFCHMGENVGFEEDGKGIDFLRPVIIYKKFNNEIFLSIPTSTKTKGGKHYFNFYHKDKDNTAILSQIRLIDAKRLKYRIGKLSDKTFKNLKEKLKMLLF